MNKYIRAAETLGADSVEICHTKTHTFSLSNEGHGRGSKEYDFSEGYSIRVLRKGRVGFAYVGKEGDLNDGVKRALSLSKFSRKTEFEFPHKKKYKKLDVYDKKIEGMDEERGSKILNDLMDSVDKPVKATHCGVEYGIGHIAIENSSGLSVSGESTNIACFVHCSLGKNSGSCFETSTHFDFNHKNIGKTATARTLEMSKATPTKGGRMPVVFEQEALHSLLSSLFLPSFHGERIQRKISLLHNKIGKEIASDEFTLSDDPLSKGPGSSYFDGEGVVCKKKKLVTCGVVSDFLYDLKTASLSKDNPSVGNCRRGSYESEPSIGVSNININEGDVKDVLECCGNGIIVSSVFGEHTANDLTGEFSVSVERGFEIKNGDKKKPIRGNVISGNIFSLLKDITGIEKGQKRYFNFISPRIAFKKIEVVG